MAIKRRARFDGAIIGDAGSFARNRETRNYDGSVVAANNPRWGDSRVICGAIPSADVVELYASGAMYEMVVLGCGVNADNRTPVMVTHERVTSGAGGTINIYIGDAKALIQSGVPTMANGYGVKQIAGGHRWYRWSSTRCGNGTGGGATVTLPNNVVDDFSTGIPNFRVAGSNGANPADSAGALLTRPVSATVFQGCVILQCTAYRYTSGTIAGANAVYSPVGTLVFSWQEATSEWAQHRDQSHFTDDTAGVKHDLEPGRMRGELWGGPRVTTPWTRSSNSVGRAWCACTDYMNAGNGPGGSNPTSKTGLSIVFEMIKSGGVWSLSEPLHFEQDETAHATLDSSETFHRHSSIVTEAELTGGVKSLQVMVFNGDATEVMGIATHVLTPTGSYIPTDTDQDIGQGTQGNWGSILYLNGDGAVSNGSRPMSAQQGPEIGEVLAFSDTNDEAVKIIDALDTTKTARIRGVYIGATSMTTYTFRCIPERPADPKTSMICDLFFTGGIDNLASGENASYKSKGFIFSPDGGESWGRLWKIGTLSNATYGFSGNNLIFGTLNAGVYAVRKPRAVKARPIRLAPGMHNVLIDNHAGAVFGPSATVANLARSGGVFVDGANPLPPDPSMLARAFKYSAPNDGNGSLVIYPSTTAAATNTGGAFTVTPRTRSFVWHSIPRWYEWPTTKPACPDLTTRTLNNGTDTGNISSLRNGAQWGVQPIANEHWSNQLSTIPHTFGAGTLANTAIRFLIEDQGGLAQPTRVNTIIAAAFEGPRWYGYPCPANTNATADPETVPLHSSEAPWEIEADTTLVAGLTLGKMVSGSVQWWSDTTLAGTPLVMTLLELGDPTGDDWVVVEITVAAPTGSSPNVVLGTRVVTIRGEAGGSPFSGTVALGDQAQAVAADPREWHWLWPETSVLVGLSVQSGGILPVVVVDGHVITGSLIAGASGIDVMQLKQVGADMDDTAAKPCEIEVFGIELHDEALDAAGMIDAMANIEFVKPIPQGGAAAMFGGIVAGSVMGDPSMQEAASLIGM